jgi:eukaryotic-like serine/threonine-protein kinase
MPARALEITSGVLAALDYSHRAGIVHRDIKPANVMLTRDGEVKVMDFGIARAVADPASTMTQTGATLGTAQYLSPEQAQGGVIDPRSDIYSTGCMLYELLTGRPPFTGDSPVSVAYQHVRENPIPPSQIDPEVSPTIDAIVMKSLAKNADNRYQSASEMREDIERALGGRPVAATPVMDETRAITTVAAADVTPDDGSNRGRNIGFALLGLAVLALIIGGVLALMNLGGGATQVTVPNLDGLKVPAAQEQLEAKKLVLGTPTERESDRPAGTIIDQSPAFPASVAEGSTVNVVVSKGPATTEVPIVVVLALADALNQLDRVGLVAPSDLRTNRGSDKPEGTVLAVEPGEGTKVDKGSSVSLVISTGKVEVPSVVGKSAEQASADIEAAGLNPSRTNQVTDDEDQVGKVIKQSPTGGTAKSGSTVVITVGTARPAPPTPTVTATPTETAEPSTEAEPPVEED